MNIKQVVLHRVKRPKTHIDLSGDGDRDRGTLNLMLISVSETLPLLSHSHSKNAAMDGFGCVLLHTFGSTVSDEFLANLLVPHTRISRMPVG